MSLAALLRLEKINRLLFRLRFLYFTKILGCVRIHQDAKAVIANQYSTDMLLKGVTSDRPLKLIRPLISIEKVSRDAKVLSVGSRFETELLYLRGYGFKSRNIRGLDMISYSPWIDTGNMHHMPYGDNSWDVVILGWVLAYSDDPWQAAREVIRIARDGAVVAAAVSYYPDKQLQALEEQGKLIGQRRTRRQTVQQLLELFGDHVDQVYFSHDAPDKDREGMCAVIFSIKKEGFARCAA